MIIYKCDCCKLEMPPEEVTNVSVATGISQVEKRYVVVNSMKVTVMFGAGIAGKDTLLCLACAGKAYKLAGITGP